MALHAVSAKHKRKPCIKRSPGRDGRCSWNLIEQDNLCCNLIVLSRDHWKGQAVQ